MLAIKKYNSYIDWNVGTMFNHTDDFLTLMSNLKKLNLDPNIKYSFGSFGCRLNSGRYVTGGNPNIEFVSKVIDLYNSFGISVRFTFSNHLITEEDLGEKLPNETMEYMEKKNVEHPEFENGVIIVSDMLREYIRKNYPHLKITSSLYKTGIETKFVSDTVDYYNELLDRFDVVVVDTNKIKDKNTDFLIGIKDKDRVEFIANNHCMRHCPNVRKHDIAVAQIQHAVCENNIEKQRELEKKVEKYLRYCHSFFLTDPDHSTLVLTDSEINLCLDMGYKHFKLQGRAAPKKEFFEDLSEYIFTDTEIENNDPDHVNTARRRRY